MSEQQRAAAWQAAMAAGGVQLELGEGVNYTAATLVEITRVAREDMHSGKPMDPDVLP
ncbi:hypothetical protein [Pseudorhodoferax sp. Leaf267]|uniref:hypothetical protein n=1 Tax=Pseudorhodoferax sp. Leaf267 TaxID=1736316 RepID=UPI0012E184F7|nr:hypothetical protein [Pseudorhodoferax sp. Leaf267]